MRLSRIIAITLALLATLAASAQPFHMEGRWNDGLSASAQTITMTLGRRDCGQYTPSHPYCDGVPVRASDGTHGSLWFNHSFTPYAQGIYGFVKFSGSIGHSTAMVSAIQPDGSLQFSGADSKGVAYYGVLSYTHTTYLKCAAGHCRTYWRITGGTASIQRVDY